MENYTQKEKIKYALRTLGVPQHLLGYEYLTTAIDLVIDDKSYAHEITRRLYPQIAELHNTTNSRVERTIRHAIEKSFSLMPHTVMFSVFGNTLSYDKDHPTNGHYIVAIADVIRSGNNEYLIPCEE